MTPAQTTHLRESLGRQSNGIVWPDELQQSEDEDDDEINSRLNQRLLRLGQSISLVCVMNAKTQLTSRTPLHRRQRVRPRPLRHRIHHFLLRFRRQFVRRRGHPLGEWHSIGIQIRHRAANFCLLDSCERCAGREGVPGRGGCQPCAGVCGGAFGRQCSSRVEDASDVDECSPSPSARGGRRGYRRSRPCGP